MCGLTAGCDAAGRLVSAGFQAYPAAHLVWHGTSHTPLRKHAMHATGRHALLIPPTVALIDCGALQIAINIYRTAAPKTTYKLLHIAQRGARGCTRCKIYRAEGNEVARCTVLPRCPQCLPRRVGHFPLGTSADTGGITPLFALPITPTDLCLRSPRARPAAGHLCQPQ